MAKIPSADPVPPDQTGDTSSTTPVPAAEVGRLGILIVDDNAPARKMARIALEKSGYQVFEAGDGRTATALLAEHQPALVVLDLHLPDVDGVALVRQLRALPAGEDIPILAFSGLLSQVQRSRALRAGFTDYIFNTAEPSDMVGMVDSYLGAPQVAGVQPGLGHRVLLVDDDPLQGKLTARRLHASGFVVELLSSGTAALAAARLHPPDAIVLDLLMPGMTGLDVCLAVRRDPQLASIPVVITSSTFSAIDDIDRNLAIEIAADGLVERTPSCREVIDRLVEVLAQTPPRVVGPNADAMSSEFIGSQMRQLKHHAWINASLMRQAAVNSTLLSIMAGTAEILTREHELPTLLKDVLARVLDAGGVSAGAIFLVDGQNPPVLGAQIGFADTALDAVAEFFGARELLQTLALGPRAVEIPSPAVDANISQLLLARADASGLIVAPLLSAGVSHGALVLRASSRDVGAGFLASITAVASQLGQAVTLSRTVERLWSSEARYRSLYEGIPTGVFRSELNGKFLDFNQEFVRLIGAPDRATLLGSSALELYARPADRIAWQDAVVRDGVVRDFETPLQRLDGTPIWVAISARAIYGADHEIRCYEGTVTDITEQKSLEAQLVQAQKMEAIGQLAAGVAHDFNNILTVISGFAEMLGDDLPAGDQHHVNVTEILRAANQAAVLTRQLLAFGRRQVLHPVVLDLNHAVTSAQAMLERLIGEHILVKSVLGAGALQVRLDPGQLEQVILNLAVNARDAMERGGTLTIETRRIELDASDAEAHALPHAGDYALLLVSDTGVGMSAAVQARVFEPFFTTKERGKGTGLGLATVYGIVKQSGGNVLVYSEVGIGTTFKLYFPLISEVDPSGERAPASVPPAGRDQVILLVEDQDAVRRFAAEVLVRHGYQVLDARDAVEAMQHAADPSRKIDVMLTDVIMPGKTGPELGEQLLKARPDLLVIYMSGYAGDAILREGVRAPGLHLLDKPFSAARLLETVGSLLAKSKR